MNPIIKQLLISGRSCLGNILSQDNELIKTSKAFSYLMGSHHDESTVNNFLSSKLTLLKKILQIKLQICSEGTKEFNQS